MDMKEALEQGRAVAAGDIGVIKKLLVRLMKSKATERIVAQYPIYAQINAALGLYNNLPTDDPFFPANMKAAIAAEIIATRRRETEIAALRTLEEIDAYRATL